MARKLQQPGQVIDSVLKWREIREGFDREQRLGFPVAPPLPPDLTYIAIVSPVWPELIFADRFRTLQLHPDLFSRLFYRRVLWNGESQNRLGSR